MSIRLSITLLLTLAVVAWTSEPSLGNPPQPQDLQVIGGADVWHADNRFELVWTNPPAGDSPPVATHYRIRDPLGRELEERQVGWLSDGLASVTVPRVPGVYSVEVWLEDAAGKHGTPANAQLRFDDARPAAIAPQAPAGWIGRDAFPLRLQLGRPSGPLPISGIRGYAVTVGTKPFATPCIAVDRCTEAETTLRGSGNDTLEVAALPEGTNYLHAVAVSGSGMTSATSGRTVLRVDTTDPVTRLSGASTAWTNRSIRLAVNASDSGSGMSPDGEGPAPLTAIRIDDRPATVELGNLAFAEVIEQGVHRVSYYARDAAGNVNDGGSRNGLAHRAPQAVTVRIDRTPPSVAFVNSQDPADPDLLRVRIADPLAGPDPRRGGIGVRRAGSADRFQPLPAVSAPPGELRARWSSDSYPRGDYEFRAVAYDGAGNSTVATRRRNGTPMVLSNPLKATTSLRSSLSAGEPISALPFGRGVLLRGRLTSGRATPLPGRSVRVIERFAAGTAVATRSSTVVTGSGGSFSLRLAPGPSRRVTAVFEGGTTLGRSAAPTLDLRVRSKLHLRASAATATIGGRPLVFRGRLIAARGEIPPGGRAVELQFRLPGLPWAEFRTVQTDHSGRFRYAYRFSDDDSRGARFQFRAYAPAQEDWPYEPAGSRPVLVRGI